MLDPSEVDPELLCREEYASRKGMIGPFGLLALASKDQTERTVISLYVYIVVDSYKCLMISGQTCLFLTRYFAVHTFPFFNDFETSCRGIQILYSDDITILEGRHGRKTVEIVLIMRMFII